MKLYQTIHKYTEAEARQYIAVQHAKYWDTLQRFCREYTAYKPPAIPSYRIVDSVFPHCGQYNPNTNTCQYSLAYCVYEGENYRETVAHELCHAMHHRIYKSKPAHGSDFLWLLRDICKFPDAQATHTLPINVVEQIGNELVEMRGGLANDVSLLDKPLSQRIAELNKRMRPQ